MNKIFIRSGVLIFPWLVVGVWVAGSYYPGYNHVNQFMSELGAVGSPTQYLSPQINNYPIGILFIIFGLGIFQRYTRVLMTRLLAVSFMFHGLGSIGTGYYSCDPGCTIFSGSIDQILHTFFGGMMFLALIGSCLFAWLCIDHRRFRTFTVVCFVSSILFLVCTIVCYRLGMWAGLFERLSYFILCAWVLVLSMVLDRGVSMLTNESGI